MSAEDFLDQLQLEGLVQDNVIETLRAQVGRAKTPITAKKVADLLVTKGHLSASQAEGLLAAGPLEPPASAASSPELTPLDADGLQPIDDAGGLVPVSEDHFEAAAELTPLAPSSTASELGGIDAFETGGSLDNMAPMAGQGALFRGKQRGLRNRWNSKWMLLGPTALVVLSMLTGLLYFVLTRGSAQELFEAAEESYRNEAYSEAIERYDDFIGAYPKDENVSQAKVRRELAQLRLPVKSANWSRALEVAQQRLPVVEQEKAFAQARDELASLLPDVADGFTQKAKKAGTTEAMLAEVELAEKAMKLVENPTYLPSSKLRNPTIAARIEAIREEIKVVHREINKERQLVATTAQIQQAAQDGRTADAFAARTALLRAYPSLQNNQALDEALLLVAQKERDLVQVGSEALDVSTEDHKRTTMASVVMANRVGSAAEAVTDRVLPILASGSVYALDAATGQVLWRRFVGYETRHHPQAVSGDPAADVIVVDSRRQELLRLSRADGRLVWRLAVNQSFANPIITRDRLLVATESGQLLSIDPTSGRSTVQAIIPQPLLVGPGFDRQWPLVYQPGQHSILYVLSATEMDCREVYYLGHQAGTIVVPPVMLRDHLVVAQNAGDGYCLLHVLFAEERGLRLRQAQKPYRLRGHVVVPPQIYGRRMLVITDLGSIHVFEVHNNEQQPLAKVASNNPLSDSPVVHYPLVDESLNLWVAGIGLSKHSIQISSNDLPLDWKKFRQDTFLGPMAMAEDALIHVRRRRGFPGVSVAAIQGETGDQIWRTDIGVPHVGKPMMQAENRLLSVSAQGNLFRIGSNVIRRGVADKPVRRPSKTEQILWFKHATALDAGRVVLSGLPQTPRLLTLDTREEEPAVRLVRLELPPGGATAAPVHFSGGLLVPWNNGQVLLLDADRGTQKATPFQPPTQPGQSVVWRRAVVQENQRQFVIADNQGRMYRVEIRDSPQPHLAAVQEAHIPPDISSPLALHGSTIYAAVRGETEDVLVGFQLADLKSQENNLPLGGRVSWGPASVGDAVLVATDGGKLYCLEGQLQVKWSSDVSYGALAGPPIQHGGDFVLASRSGVIWRVSGDSGSELAMADIGQPCGSGPLALPNGFCLYAHDGTLQVVPPLRPSS